MIIKTQNGKNIYSDGDETELEMLSIASKYPGDLSEDYISSDSRYTVNNTYSSVRHNILNWYSFKPNAEILEIGAGMGAITGMLCDQALKVTAVEMNELRAEVIRTRHSKRENLEVISVDVNYWNTEKKYDYVVVVGVLEYATVFMSDENPAESFIKNLKKYLKVDGTILLAIENQFGLKYWCGASEDHLQEPFVGLEGYKKKGTPTTYSREQLNLILDKTGLVNRRIYYVLPDYKFPTFICTDEYKPNAEDLEKIAFTYSKNSMLTVNEKDLYKQLLENDVFGFFANSYLIEASESELSETYPIFISGRGESKKEFRIATVIYNDESVKKIPVHKEALKHIHSIYSNEQELIQNGVRILPTTLKDNVIISKFVHLKRADNVFYEMLLDNDLKSVFTLVKQLKDNLLKSSKLASGPDNIANANGLNPDNYYLGLILQSGFIDMTFYNAFVDNGELVFFDQEWKFSEVPLNFILYYAVKIAYQRFKGKTNIKFENILDYLEIKDERVVYERLEDFIWSTVLYRQGDFYGDEGYCNQFDESLTLKKYLTDMSSELNQYKNKAVDNHNELLKSNQEISQLRDRINSLNTEMNKAQELIVDKYEVELSKYELEVSEYKNEINRYKNEINNKIGHIELLLDREREFERYQKRLGWKISRAMDGFKALVLPQNSYRRNIIIILKKIFGNISVYSRYMNFKNLKKLRYYLKSEGLNRVVERLKHFEERHSIQPARTYDVFIKNINTEEGIEFIYEEKPLVSIVIPVYNQWEYTYSCLKSILENVHNVSYEIIIADDVSSDETKEIGKYIKNINLIRNDKNQGFLLNCNNAAKDARGKYIVFLNNDTNVQVNWLESLVELIESDSKIGMVGSKLVYPDGKLQEAGGIIWNDASGWNYGRFDDPEKSEYNYVKEVDYISGASIMIRKKLWENIGGFDERYIPAYCEDSDLAFEVRKNGFKVMYQPQSIVIHFEGISHGTDEKSGLKKYQVENKVKFEEKWKKVLKKEHFENAVNVFEARDRSHVKKCVLVIDHYVPHYDKDAGSRTVYQYLKLLTKMGLNVKFIGDNYFKHEPYTTELQKYGIEVLYGKHYFDNWQTWIKDNAKSFDYIWLNRPHISEKYIDFVKNSTNAKIIYYGHDLHFLRELREYDLTKAKEKLASSKLWREKELKLIQQADISVYPSEVEVNEIKSIDENANVIALPAYIYPLRDLDDYNFDNRNGIMFIGGFGHTPNIDGLIWFAKEVMPLVIKQNQEIILYVLGSNPTHEILGLESKNIIVKGFVTDEELEGFYRKTRISVVPLRYGAGIKGKVIEAMYNQVPVISTSVGAEGILSAGKALKVVDDPIEFANAIVELYNNERVLTEMSNDSRKFINENYSDIKVTELAKKSLG